MDWEEKFLKNVETTSDRYINIKEFEIGKVISLEPLQIMLGDLPLFQSNLYMNTDLLASTREFTTLTGTVGDNAITIANGSIFLKSQLKENDLVVLRELNKTTYIVMFKVTKGV